MEKKKEFNYLYLKVRNKKKNTEVNLIRNDLRDFTKSLNQCFKTYKI